MHFKKRLVVGVVALSAVLYAYAGAANEELSVAKEFQSFQDKYHKVYASSSVSAYRQKIFGQNLAKIRAFNAGDHSWKMAVNQYADLTWEEFSKSRLQQTGSGSLLAAHSSGHQFRPPNRSDIPESLDWRELNAVTPVRDQGQCGSCWAFSVVGAMESAAAINLSLDVDLSEQEFLNCDTVDGACDGGMIDTGFEYAKDGVGSEECTPYLAEADSCALEGCAPVVKVVDYQQVTINDEIALKEAVAVQPISIGVEADADAFQFYSSGVVTSKSCGTDLNHAILIVGYGVEDGQPYWLCKNSWGAEWGDAGYIKIGRKLKKGGPGICGIASEPWAVTVASAK